ncbi:MAG: M16 family metallopeptidase [Pirellulaceae bacterium]
MKRFFCHLLAAVALTLSPDVCHRSAAEETMPRLITTVEGITEYRLDNGVQVLLFPDNSKPVVTVNMTIFVGSRHEGYGEAGMAHLLEHMLFKGTPNHPEVPKALQDRGAQFNGTTWLDRTNYFETLAAEKDNLEFAIRLEADRLVNSFVRGEDLISEMTVVRNEFERGENSPLSVLQQRMFSAAYQWHNYGNSTIGNRSDIERVPIDKLREFYRKFYRPDNVMLVIAGKFVPSEALDLVQKYFGVLDNPPAPIDRTYTVEPPQDGERTTVVRRVGESQYVGAAYHIPAGADPEYVPVEVLATLLATEPSGRLYKSLVVTQKATSVLGGSFGLHDPGLMFYGAEVPKDKSIEEARVALLETLESFERFPVTAEEVDRANTELLKARELQSSNSTQLATELSEWAAQGDWRLYFLHRDRLEAVTPDAVQAVAQKYLVRNNRTVGLFLPTEKSEKATVPDRPDVARMLADYQGREDVTAGEEFDPTPDAIESRTQKGVTPSGLKYSLLPKKTRGNSVNLQIQLRFGNEQALFGKSTEVDLLGDWMGRGTQSMDYQQLKDALDRLRANVALSAVPGLMTLRVSTKREYLPELLPILQEMLRAPRFAPEELQILIKEQQTALESQRSEPDALAPLAVSRAMNQYPKGDPRYTPTIDEALEGLAQVTPDSIRQLYQQQINGSNAELIAVGDFDPEQMREQVEQIVAGWTSEVPFQRFATLANTSVEGQMIQIETPDKANSVFYARQQWPMREDHPQLAALTVGNFILGGGALSSRLGDRVRQKEGLSYGIGSGLSAHPVDERGDLTMYAITNPANKDKLLKAIQEELKRLLDEGITEKELEDAKQGLLQGQQVARSNDIRLAQILAGNLFAKRDMMFQKQFEQKLASLTVDEVNAALREWIRPERIVMATAGDFANAQPEAAVEKGNGQEKK